MSKWKKKYFKNKTQDTLLHINLINLQKNFMINLSEEEELEGISSKSEIYNYIYKAITMINNYLVLCSEMVNARICSIFKHVITKMELKYKNFIPTFAYHHLTFDHCCRCSGQSWLIFSPLGHWTGSQLQSDHGTNQISNVCGRSVV